MTTNTHKTDPSQAAFTAICLVEGFTGNNPSNWEALNVEYRDNHGFAQWREKVAEFAVNIELAFNDLDAHLNGSLMEVLAESEKQLDCYDFDLIPYIAQKAAEKQSISLSIDEVKTVISQLTDTPDINPK